LERKPSQETVKQGSLGAKNVAVSGVERQCLVCLWQNETVKQQRERRCAEAQEQTERKRELNSDSSGF